MGQRWGSVQVSGRLPGSRSCQERCGGSQGNRAQLGGDQAPNRAAAAGIQGLQLGHRGGRQRALQPGGQHSLRRGQQKPPGARAVVDVGMRLPLEGGCAVDGAQTHGVQLEGSCAAT